MWIRSQNRRGIEKVSNMYISDDNHIETDIVVPEKGKLLLGRYDTRQRALEVLDEIQEAIVAGKKFYQMPER